MKVKEILQVLDIDADALIQDLENVGIPAKLDTDIDPITIKKLSKKYGVDIKPIKAKKPSKQPTKAPTEQKVPEVKERAKAKTVETKPIESKPKEQPKKPVVKEDKKPVEVRTERDKKPVEAKIPTDISKKTPKVEVKPKEEPEIELTRVYDDLYQDFEEQTKTYTRLKNVKKRSSKSIRNRQTNLPLEN